MTIKEKLAYAGGNELYLFKEGAFWVAYEQSAYWFHLQKGYKATKKFVKAAGQDVVSVGFPESALVNKGALRMEEKENMRVIFPEENIDVTNFSMWKESLSLKSSVKGETVKVTVNASRSQEENADAVDNPLVIERLRKFDLSNATPMECMIFLAEVKKTLQEK